MPKMGVRLPLRHLSLKGQWNLIKIIMSLAGKPSSLAYDRFVTKCENLSFGYGVKKASSSNVASATLCVLSRNRQFDFGINDSKIKCDSTLESSIPKSNPIRLWNQRFQNRIRFDK